MSPTQRVSLRRSCQYCARVKRRCDLAAPQCGRCLQRGQECSYDNEPTTPWKPRPSAELSSYRRSPLRTARNSNRGRSSSPRASSTSRKSDEDVENETRIRTRLASTTSSEDTGPFILAFSKFHAPQIKIKLGAPTILAFIGHIRSFPRMFVETGKTPFIHPHLYPNGLLDPVQEVYNICARHTRQSPGNELLLSETIEETAVNLIESETARTSFQNFLATVQALTLIQILRLFNLKLEDRQLAEQHQELLGQWTYQLWQQAPSQLPSNLTPWRAWLFAESVRRTVLISHCVNGAYSMLKHGYCVNNLFIWALPFDTRSKLWEAHDRETWMQIAAPTPRRDLLSFREYTNAWLDGDFDEIGVLERLLLIVCKGVEAVERYHTRPMEPPHTGVGGMRPHGHGSGACQMLQRMVDIDNGAPNLPRGCS